MRSIPLTQGQIAVVDDIDFERINRSKWHAKLFGVKKKKWYAYGRPKDDQGKRQYISMPAFIMKPEPGLIVDHKNGNTLDNRRRNLRICTQKENTCNTQKSRGFSRYKGVRLDQGSNFWRAQIHINGTIRSIGRFLTEEEAAEAYNREAKNLFGEFAWLNVIEKKTDSEKSRD